MLSATGLSKSYRGHTAVHSASLEVDRGQIVGLLGPNGAGKTTCFQMISGIVTTDSGSIVLDQVDVTALPLHARARLGLGYLPQEPSVFRNLSVSENVMSVLELRGELSRSDRKGELERLLDELQVGHLTARLGKQLSGGEVRRVEIARALAADPRYVLLDEPFAGVDPISVGDIQRVVRYLAEDRGLGILITDHNARETLRLCHHAAILEGGRVLASGSPAEICEHSEVRDAYLGEEFLL